jgi:glycosyltransferase involved in cell wall biosynthesis
LKKGSSSVNRAHRIVFISVSTLSLDHQRLGAVEGVIYSLARYFTKLGLPCSVLMPNSASSIRRNDGLVGQAKAIFEKIIISKRFARQLKKTDPVAVMIWDVVPLVVLWICAPELRSKVVYTASSSRWPAMRGWGHFGEAVLDLLFVTLAKLVLRTLNCTIVQSQSYYEKFNQHVPKDRLVLIPPPLLSFPPPSSLRKHQEETSVIDTLLGRHIVLFVGRKIPEKGIENLIIASSILAKSGLGPFSVLLVGPDGMWGDSETLYVHKLKSLCEKLGLTKIVGFVGTVDRSSLATFYQAADVLVLPSLSEAFGHVVTEAMSFGKPVIGSDVGGISLQVSNGVNGFLVPPGNPQELANRLKQLLSDDSLRERLGHNARIAASKYSIEATARKYLSCIKKATNRDALKW